MPIGGLVDGAKWPKVIRSDTPASPASDQA